jgi:quercetin dioxygenase-like cupin family protein
MKHRASLSLSFVAALLFFASSTARAQDPVVVNSATVTVKLENDRVRVLEAVLEPGHKETPHSHPGYVTYVLTTGKMRMHAADGTSRDAALTAGQVLFTEPLTHWAENIGTTTMRFVLVELKPSQVALTGKASK